MARRARLTRLTPLADVPSRPDSLGAFGRRAVALGDALARGVPVLDSWVLPASGFRDAVRDALPPGHDPASLLRVIERPVGQRRAAEARERLLSLSLSESLSADLSSFWLDFGADAPWGLLVSCSPTVADDTIASSAGLDAVLRGVKSERALRSAVRYIWATAVYEDTLRMLRARRIRDFAVAVIVQLLDATAAHGRLLVHGTDRHGSLGVTTCALGLAAPVIDGTCARDVAHFSRDGRLVEDRIAVKTQALVVGDGGAEFSDTSAPEAGRLALPARARRRLRKLADGLGQVAPSPLVAEYVASVAGEVRVASLRLAAGGGYPPGGDALTVWSRVGLGEELPGPMAPLTWSLVEAFSKDRLRRVLSTSGCRLPRGASLWERIHGRAYSNLSTFIPLLLQTPAVEPRGALGLVPAEEAQVLERHLEARHSSTSVARLPITAARMLVQERRLEAELRQLERELERHRRWFAEMDLAILPDDALLSTMSDLRARFQQCAGLLLGYVLVTLSSYLALHELLARTMPASAARVVQLVTAGVGGLDSAEIAALLAQVIAITQQDAPARAVLVEGPPATVRELPHGPARRATLAFLEAFGDRGMREADLMSARWGQQPRPLLGMIAAGLWHEPIDPQAASSYVRVQSEAALADLEARVTLAEGALARTLVKRTRRLIAHRERTRTWVARLLGMLRGVAVDAGRRLRLPAIAGAPSAVLFASFDELEQALQGGRSDLGAVTRLRQAAFERDAGHADPPESFAGLPPALAVPPDDGRQLRGAPCCTGVVVGPARVVGPLGLGADRLRPGEIIVTKAADVGLSPLLLMASGVVAELGGPLSAGSVVAREYGVPTVAGLAGVCGLIRDGERLRLDGARGIVERLDP